MDTVLVGVVWVSITSIYQSTLQIHAYTNRINTAVL